MHSQDEAHRGGIREEKDCHHINAAEWGLGQRIRKEAIPALNIPDNDPTGVASIIEVTESGTAQAIIIDIDITHTYIGDLRVVIEAPSGQQALLHDQFGGSADNLIATFDSIANPALADLIGESIQGDWALRVADLVGQDTGKLNLWRLELTH